MGCRSWFGGLSKVAGSFRASALAVVMTLLAILAGCSGTSDDQDLGTLPDAKAEVTACEGDGGCVSDNPCLAGSCQDGFCKWEPADGSCDDGDPCTEEDQCTDGACAGTARQCDDSLVCNGAESCDPETGECLAGNPPELDDGVECTVDECDEEGKKVVNTPTDELCDDGNPCTVAMCDAEMGCIMEFATGTCDDGDPCTDDDTCTEGVCLGKDKDCDDGEFCNGVEQCNGESGECEPGEAVGLDDEIDCTVDECDEEADEVIHTPDDALCDDDNPCTNDLCKADAGCDYLDNKEPCEDQEECTVDDKCADGVCQPGEWTCFEDCANDEDDDKDDLVDCDDPDCDWDLACLPDGEICATALPLNQAEALVMNGVVYFEGTTIGKSADLAGSCSPATDQCADTVHVLQLAEPLGLILTVDYDGQAWPAIYVLDEECAAEKFCDAASSALAFETVVVLPAGTYHFVVDGAFAGDEGNYTLQIETFAPAQFESGCTNGLDDDADGKTDCQDSDCKDHPQCESIAGDSCEDAISMFDKDVSDDGQAWEFQFKGNTKQLKNDLSASCDPDTATQQDQVFVFTLQDGMWMDASHDFDGNEYPAIYLLDSECGEGEELGCATAQSAAATLSLPLVPGTYYAVVDAAYSGDAGAFVLDATFTSVPKTEADCSNGLDDDLDGLPDCDDEDCQENVLCVGLPGDKCEQAMLINDGKPVTVEHAGVTIEFEGTTTGLGDDYAGPCDADTDGSPDLVYLLNLEAPMVVSLSYDFTNNSYPALYVLDGDCDDANVFACDAASTAAAELQVTLPAGTYYFVLDGSFKQGQTGDHGPFEFSVTFYLPPETEVDCFNGSDDDVDGFTDCEDTDCEVELYCQDPYEPNDTFDTAYELGDIEGQFVAEPGTMVYPDADEDWFRFELAQPAFISASLTQGEGLDAKLFLYDGKGAKLLTADEPESFTYGVYEAGSYYVKIGGFVAESAGSYALSINLDPPAATETVCNDDLDDDLDGHTDCADDDCDADANCGAGDSCDAPLAVNDGVPVTVEMSGLQLAYEGSTVGYAGDLSGSCSEASALAADAVWQFSLEAQMVVAMVVDYEGFEYPSLYLLKDGCPGQEAACGAGDKDPLVVEALLEPGQYHVVVDGNWKDDESPYTLSFAFTIPVLNETNCSDGIDEDQDDLTDCCDEDCAQDDFCQIEDLCINGGDDDCDGFVDCDDGDCHAQEICFGLSCDFPLVVNEGIEVTGLDDGLELVYQGDTTGMGNHFTGSCSVASQGASDAVWMFELADQMDVTVSHDYADFGYPALYLFKDGCEGEEVGCATETADAAVVSAMLEPGAYHVVVDGDFAGDAEPYTLTFLFQTPTETECYNGLDDDNDGVPDCLDDDCIDAPQCLGETCLQPFLVNDGNPIVPSGQGDVGVFELQGSTEDMAGEYAGTCDIDTAESPDAVWKFVIEDKVNLSMSHDFDDISYPAVYLFQGDCVAETELACATGETGAAVANNIILQPGTYYVVVDASFAGDANTYTLSLGFSAVPDSETDCADGVDNDGDLLTDCCDDDCVADLDCYEFDCGDGIDNDCDQSTDCDDDDCDASGYCVVMQLPFAEEFEDKGAWPDGFQTGGPDNKCLWETDMDGAQGTDFSMHMGFAACSESESYNLYTPQLDVSLCEKIKVRFYQKGMFAEWTQWHGVGIDDGDSEVVNELAPVLADGEWTLAGPYIFDVTGIDILRVFFGYMGDNADDWWVDGVEVECSVPVGGPSCSGKVDVATFKELCQEGPVDVTLADATVTYLFEAGYFLQDATGAIEVYVGDQWGYDPPTVSDVIDLHVTEYGSFANHQEVTASDPPLVIGQGDAFGLATDISTGTVPSESIESFLVTATALEVVAVDDLNVTVAYGTAQDITLRVDDSAGLCAGAVVDIAAAVVTHWWDMHRLQVFNAAVDLANLNTDNCVFPEDVDDSNWGFEEEGQDDPPYDFEKATVGFTATNTVDQFHAGAQACELTWDSVENLDFYQGWYMPIEAGQVATFTVWALDNDPAGRIRQFVKFYDANQDSVKNTYGNVFSEDGVDWVQLTYAAEAPADALFVRAFLRLYDYGVDWDGDATVYVDDWDVSIQ